MSSFRRAGVADTGTRPGLHGHTLISMGLVDLDRLLSGGLPLASVLLVLEDACSGQHLNLMRYFIAEGLACRQRVLWLTASQPPGGAGAFLPAQASASKSTGSAADEDGQKEQPELRIAWQYKKYIKDEQPPHAGVSGGKGTQSAGRVGASSSSASSASSSASRALAAGVGREWCHTYDLTKQLGEDAVRGSTLEVVQCGASTAYSEADRHAAAFLSAFQTASEVSGLGPSSSAAAAGAVTPALSGFTRRPEPVGRLVIESAGSLAWGGVDGASEQALIRLLYNVRQRVLQTRCAAMVTVPAGLLRPGCAARLPHLADTVLALEGLADDLPLFKLLPDPNTAVALLSVRKLSSAGMVGPRVADGQLYVVRNKRRRLGLSPVEVDPDAEERQAEAAARAAEAFGGRASAASGAGVTSAAAVAAAAAGPGKGAKSAASMLCGGPPASGNKALDF